MALLSDDNKEKLNGFVKFVKTQLDLESLPTIVIKSSRDGLKTTANYDYTKENKVIKVYGKNRALVDVMRSVAHELVHHKQNQRGDLKDNPTAGDDGSPEENEANSKAGELIRIFGRQNPEMYET